MQYLIMFTAAGLCMVIDQVDSENVPPPTKAEITKKLGERIQDINSWKFELEREIRNLIEETDVLLSHKKRLENAIRATELALLIATDNLNCRERRKTRDLVQDDVELSLLKEVELINNVKDLLKKTIDQGEKQIQLNREAKENLELDWSDLKEALEIDTVSGALKNHHTFNKQFYPGAANLKEIQSTPDSWKQFAHDDIVCAEHERVASMQLRQLIDNILEDTSRDMREQCDTVDMEFQETVTEMEEPLTKMEENFEKVRGEINQVESNIENLKKAIRDKENPMEVAQTRLENRTFAPNVEICRNRVQYMLVDEVNGIHSSSVH